MFHRPQCIILAKFVASFQLLLRIPTAHANSCCNGSTSLIVRAHRGRFVGKYSTFGLNDNFSTILRFKEVGDPHFFFFLDTTPSLANFCRLSKNQQKINVGSLIFFSVFYTRAIEFHALRTSARVWKCNYLKVEYICLIDSPK